MSKVIELFDGLIDSDTVVSDELNVEGVATLSIELESWDSDVTSVTFQGQLAADGGEWTSVRGVNVATGIMGATASANGIYVFSVSGLSRFRLALVILRRTELLARALLEQADTPIYGNQIDIELGELLDVNLQLDGTDVDSDLPIPVAQEGDWDINATLQLGDSDVDSDNPIPVALEDGATLSVLQSGSWAVTMQLGDSDVDSDNRLPVVLEELPGVAALTDSTANPELSAIAAYMMAFDDTAATWERVRMLRSTEADGIDNDAFNGSLVTQSVIRGLNAGGNYDRIRGTVAYGLEVDVTNDSDKAIPVAQEGTWAVDANLQVGDVDVDSDNPVLVAQEGAWAVGQSGNWDVTVQLGDSDVDSDNPLPVALEAGATVAATQSGTWAVDATMQLGDSDVDSDNPLPVALEAGATLAATQSGNWDVTVQLGDSDVDSDNPLPVALEDGSTVTMVSEWTSLELEGTADTDNILDFTVPASTEYHVMSIYVTFDPDSDVGDSDRQLEVQVLDNDSDVVARFVTGAVQPVGPTYDYVLAPGVIDITSVRDTNYMSTPIPATLILPAAFRLRVFDNKAAPGGDSIVVRAMVQQRSV